MKKIFACCHLFRKLRTKNRELHKQVEELKKDKFRLGIEITHLYQKNIETEQKLQDCIGGLP
jgi:hypothetical protein